MAETIRQPKAIQKKSRRHQVRQIRPNWFRVSDIDTHRVYDVNLGVNGGTCTCPWGRHRPGNDHRSGCSHVIAALNYRAHRQGRQISVWTDEADARRQHRPMLKIGDGVIITSRIE